MSDAAFKAAPFASYTTAQLRNFIAECRGDVDHMTGEIARREKVAAGDWSVMTPAERLRHIRAEG